MIRLENISIVNNMSNNLLKNVSLFIPSGSIVSIDGKQASGKTRLLKMLGMIQKPAEGNLYLLGKNIKRLNSKEMSATRKEIGIVFQENYFVTNFNLELNITYPLILKKERKKRHRACT